MSEEEKTPSTMSKDSILKDDEKNNLFHEDLAEKAKPNLLFTTHIQWDNGAKETVYHVAAPQFVGKDLIQLICKDNLVVVNSAFIRKATTSVEEVKPTNGSRIIV